MLAVFLVSLVTMLVLPANTDFFAMTSNYKPLVSVLLVYIANMYLPVEAKLFASSMSDPITLYVYAALVFAIAITLPVFAYQAYGFIAPGLYKHEKKSVFPFVSVVIVLFVIGAAFGFFFLAPSFIQGFIPFYQAVNAIELFPIMDFYGIIFLTIIVSGILFTIPAFFALLVKYNILHTKTITKQRKYIYAGLGVAAMIISPGATPIGDLYLFVALVALLEVGVFVGKRYEHKLGIENTQSKMSQWLAPAPICRFCKAQTQENSSYCPNCKRALV